MAHDVTVYYAPGCSTCLTALQFLESHRVPFVKKDIVAYPDEMTALLERTHDINGTPVIVIDGESYQGFNPEELARVLDLG